MRWFLTLMIVAGFSLSGFAQEERLKGQVHSGSSLEPISSVYLKMGLYSAKTDYEGRFSIRYTENEALVLSHSSYNTQKVPVGHIAHRSELNFYLTPASNMASTIIEGSGVQTVYENEFEHVYDYTFVNDTLIVLSSLIVGKSQSFDKTPNENCAYTALRFGESIDRRIIPNNIYRVFNHPNGSLFLVAPDTSYTLLRTPEKLTLTGFDFDDFKSTVSLDYAATSETIFFAYQYPYIPLVAHKVYSRSADETYLLKMIGNQKYVDKVTDDFEMLTKEEIDIAKELETKTGVNYQMFSTYIRGSYLNRDLSPPYAPGFMVNNEVIIFDHSNNMALYFDSRGNFLRSTGMYHSNLTRERLVEMIQDPFTEQLYTLHRKSGVFYLRKIDPETGASGQPFKLHYPFAEMVKVFENYVYYIHKSPIEETVKHLVREELPFTTKQHSVNNFVEPNE